MLHVFLVWPWNPKTNLQKSVFWNIEWFLSYLTFYPSKKTAPPLIRVEKNFFEIGPAGYQKKRNFALISKMCRSLEFGKRVKFIYKQTEFLGTWKILQKSFFWEKIFGNFLTQEFYTFLKSVQNSASFDTLHTQFLRNFFSTLIRDGAVFFEG